MGVETELIVASIDKAQIVCESNSPQVDFDHAGNFKGLDMVMLVTLYAVLTETKYDDKLIAEFKCLHQISEMGPWVYFVPSQIVSAVAQLKDERFEDVVLKWEESEEISNVMWQNSSEDIFSDSLEQLRELSKKSIDSSTPMLFWMSL